MKLLCSVMLCSAIAVAQQASLAVVHARVWTGNPAQPWAEALAVNGDAILAVGDAASVQKLISPRTRVIDARGGMVTPGFIDSHVHPLGTYGLLLAIAFFAGTALAKRQARLDGLAPAAI